MVRRWPTAWLILPLLSIGLISIGLAMREWINIYWLDMSYASTDATITQRHVEFTRHGITFWVHYQYSYPSMSTLSVLQGEQQVNSMAYQQLVEGSQTRVRYVPQYPQLVSLADTVVDYTLRDFWTLFGLSWNSMLLIIFVNTLYRDKQHQ